MTNLETRVQWDETDDGLSGVVYRSNLLAADRSVVNFGGGNTSVKTRELDHVGNEIDVLWVKGSGSDLATIAAEGFCGLRLDEVLVLRARDELSDEAMVRHLARCQLTPDMPRASIETLLHAFIPHAHVDHTHPDAIGALVGCVDGEQLAGACFGDEALWIPYLRPGFALSKLVAAAIDAHPDARVVLLAKHGLVTWGPSARAAYEASLEAIDRAASFIEARRVAARPVRVDVDADPDVDLIAEILPVLRGAVSRGSAAKIVQVDRSEPVIRFLGRADAEALSQVGASCPDHLVHTKRRPLWISFDPALDSCADLVARVVPAVEQYRAEEFAYFEKHSAAGDTCVDLNPRVILIEGVGLISIGSNSGNARLARDLYHRAIEVMEGAVTLGGYVSLDEPESYAVEYWPLELYKLSRRPQPRELEGRVAFVTGGAGGIGSAIARRLSAQGAAVVLVDLDEKGASLIAEELEGPAAAFPADVTSETDVAAAFRNAILSFGGVDIVVSNAGIASSAPIEETSLELWQRNLAVLATGYFLVSREAARLFLRQQMKGSIVFVVSKNGLVAGRNAAAYSSAKAAELHLARCLAEELGPSGIRVNCVNPDAVLQGSKIWGSDWREDRAAAYGIDPDELEDFYRSRTTLRVNIYPEDIAEVVSFFVSERQSGKSTGNIVNIDGGVPAAYTR